MYFYIFDDRHHGWVAILSSSSECKKLLRDESLVVYCFKVNEKKTTDVKIYEYVSEYYDSLNVNDLDNLVYEAKKTDKFYLINLDKLKKDQWIQLSPF